MKRFAGICVVLAGLWILAAQPVTAQNVGITRCKRYTEVTSQASTSLSSRPATVCSVQLFATSANAWGMVFDSPSNTDQQSVEHAQLLHVSEPGVTTAGNYASGWFGQQGILTHFGLGAYVVNGRMIISWDDD